MNSLLFSSILRNHGSTQHSESLFDYHIWLDPRNAVAMVDYITAVLTEQYPQHAATFHRNAALTVEQLEGHHLRGLGDLAGQCQEQGPGAAVAEVDDHVHVPIVKGYWQFNMIDDSTTLVRYQFLSDPGLPMPDWLINMFIVKNPYKTLQNLRERLE